MTPQQKLDALLIIKHALSKEERAMLELGTSRNKHRLRQVYWAMIDELHEKYHKEQGND